MSNPTFVQGPITFEAAEKVEKFTLVTVDGDGKIKPAGAEGAVFGAVTEVADPGSYAKPNHVGVHYGPAAVKLLVDGDAGEFKAGDAVFAAAGGKVATAGTVQVGVAVRAGEGERVLTVLNSLPTAG